MELKPKLKELLNNGEGHTIWKATPVFEALDEMGIVLAFKKTFFDVHYGDAIARLPVIGAPKKKPESKYDIVSWEGTKDDIGIWDLDLIRCVCDLAGEKNEVRQCLGRGFQYRAYQEWLMPKEEKCAK